MRILFLLLLPLLAASVCAQEVSTVVFAQKRFTVCRVDLSRTRLHLFLRDDSGAAFKSFDALDGWLQRRGSRLVFAMNAGMYERDFSPVGLFVEDGKELSPLNLHDGAGNFFLRPNGVFAITASGARIVESGAYLAIAKTVSLATQSGPMLVTGGRIHPAFKEDSRSLLFRNGIGVASAWQVVLVISEEPVNFYQFASLFRDGLHCQDALFLDGTISILYSAALKRDDRKFDLGPIIAITGSLEK